MKTLKVKSILFSLLAVMAVAVFMTSCEQEEANIPQDVVTTTETLTYRLSIPEGVTAETVAEWFNQLSEEEIEEYLIEDFDIITSRSCASWSSWSTHHSTYFSCFSRSCPNPQSQETVKETRARIRVCSWGTECQVESNNYITCRPPC